MVFSLNHTTVLKPTSRKIEFLADQKRSNIYTMSYAGNDLLSILRLLTNRLHSLARSLIDKSDFVKEG